MPERLAGPEPGIYEIDEIDARIGAYDWSFARERAGEIEVMWARDSARNPGLFNGRVLAMHEAGLDGTVFRCRYFETDYKPFYCWHRMGLPPPVRNGFGMAALKSRDGAYLCGVMSENTANAGKIYFAAGTPDRGDVRGDGSVDIEGSVLRELAEETGLRAGEVTISGGFTLVLSSMRAAFMRPVSLDLNADEARRLMLERIKRLPEEELTDIYIVRSPADIIEERMPEFLKLYFKREFAR